MLGDQRIVAGVRRFGGKVAASFASHAIAPGVRCRAAFGNVVGCLVRTTHADVARAALPPSGRDGETNLGRAEKQPFNQAAVLAGIGEHRRGSRFNLRQILRPFPETIF